MKRGNKVKNIRFIFIILIFLIIIFSIGYTNSKYINQTRSETDLIAKSILTLSNNTLAYREENLFPRRYKNL
ncbi:MAG: hypothetical protein HFJ44_02845 [Clostridia bacterium]|nr:hypothetical protein [Clostridia bacterium]